MFRTVVAIVVHDEIATLKRCLTFMAFEVGHMEAFVTISHISPNDRLAAVITESRLGSLVAS